MFRAAWGFQEDPAALDEQQTVIPQSTSARQDPGGSKVLPQAGLSSSTGGARSCIAAVLPRVVFQPLEWFPCHKPMQSVPSPGSREVPSRFQCPPGQEPPSPPLAAGSSAQPAQPAQQEMNVAYPRPLKKRAGFCSFPSPAVLLASLSSPISLII